MKMEMRLSLNLEDEVDKATLKEYVEKAVLTMNGQLDARDPLRSISKVRVTGLRSSLTSTQAQSLGGKKRWAGTSLAQRRLQARKAAEARWAKERSEPE